LLAEYAAMPAEGSIPRRAAACGLWICEPDVMKGSKRHVDH
jgi:hypothetical protein